jgi:hypothetical protein
MFPNKTLINSQKQDFMYNVNEKWYLFKLFQEWGEGIRENGAGGELTMIYLRYCKKFCNCHSVPLPSTIKKFKNVYKLFHIS